MANTIERIGVHHCAEMLCIINGYLENNQLMISALMLIWNLLTNLAKTDNF